VINYYFYLITTKTEKWENVGVADLTENYRIISSQRFQLKPPPTLVFPCNPSSRTVIN